MPDDFAHFVNANLRPFVPTKRGQQKGDTSLVFGRFPARSCPADGTTVVPFYNASVQELLSRNGELAFHNRQLTVALAKLHAQAAEPAARVANLTPRQQQIMALVLAGHPSKNIAADLNISQRTVENHRAAIMRRTGAASIPALVRLSLT